jgi:hypothetical protein
MVASSWASAAWSYAQCVALHVHICLLQEIDAVIIGAWYGTGRNSRTVSVCIKGLVVAEYPACQWAALLNTVRMRRGRSHGTQWACKSVLVSVKPHPYWTNIKMTVSTYTDEPSGLTLSTAAA